MSLSPMTYRPSLVAYVVDGKLIEVTTGRYKRRVVVRTNIVVVVSVSSSSSSSCWHSRVSVCSSATVSYNIVGYRPTTTSLHSNVTNYDMLH